MTEQEMTRGGRNSGPFLPAFLIGGLIGATTALLMAPQSGEKTRTMLRDKGTQLRDKGLELKDNLVDKAEEVRARAEQAVADTRGRVSQVADEATGQAEEMARAARERISAAAYRDQQEIKTPQPRPKKAVEAVE
jgi:gas vesicle protein